MAGVHGEVQVPVCPHRAAERVEHDDVAYVLQGSGAGSAGVHADEAFAAAFTIVKT
jgi:hypothetical protein